VETLNRSLQEEQLAAIGTIGFPSLIVAGYVALVGLGLWGFIRRSDAAPSPAADSSAAIICRCLPPPPAPPRRSSVRPATLRLGDVPVVHRL